MAHFFNANQYNMAFRHDRIQHWEMPHYHREHPRQLEGFTQIIANDRGHMLPGVRRARTNQWGPFVGTWDLPKKLPSTSMGITTARTYEGADYLYRLKTEGDLSVAGKYKFSKIYGDKELPIQTFAPKHPMKMVDIETGEPVIKPEVMDPPKTPDEVYKYPPKPKSRGSTNTPITATRNKVTSADVQAFQQERNRNTSAMSGVSNVNKITDVDNPALIKNDNDNNEYKTSLNDISCNEVANKIKLPAAQTPSKLDNVSEYREVTPKLDVMDMQNNMLPKSSGSPLDQPPRSRNASRKSSSRNLCRDNDQNILKQTQNESKTPVSDTDDRNQQSTPNKEADVSQLVAQLQYPDNFVRKSVPDTEGLDAYKMEVQSRRDRDNTLIDNSE